MASDESGGSRPQPNADSSQTMNDRRSRSVADMLWLWPLLGIVVVSLVGAVVNWPAAAVTAAFVVALGGTALAWVVRSASVSVAAFVVAAVVLGGLLTRELAKDDHQVLQATVGTDKISNKRKDPIATAKACGEARTAGATAGELGRTNGACDAEAQEAEEEPRPPSAAEARAEVISKLTEAFEACAALIHRAGDHQSGPLTDQDCDPVREAVSAIAGSRLKGGSK
jgi:hypothetical protein